MKSKSKRQKAKVAARRVEAPATTGGQASSQKGRRFTTDQKAHALTLIGAGMKREQVAALIGTTTESLRRWVVAAKASATMPQAAAPTSSRVRTGQAQPAQAVLPLEALTKAGRPRSPYAPADPAQGLGEHEVAAILELKKAHPSMGPAQLRAQLKRGCISPPDGVFKGWRLSNKAIARVLRGHGYELASACTAAASRRDPSPSASRRRGETRSGRWTSPRCGWATSGSLCSSSWTHVEHLVM